MANKVERYPDQCSREFQEADKQRRREMSNASAKVKALREKKLAMSQNIPGLCEKNCSCDICRSARKNCKEYMDLVYEIFDADAEYQLLKTIDDCATRDVGMPIRGSHTKNNEMFLAINKS